MPHDLTHASFFSGVGGLDLGLERAGFRTVSFSEIDPYASAVLAERWPGVPNLGDITALADGRRVGQSAVGAGVGCALCGTVAGHRAGCTYGAVLWTGGFPCQDLSVAGKRRGMGTDGDRTRSGLAHTFLDLVERYRPPALILENVPGLLSSNAGRDFGTLLGTLGKLGYGWAYRVLDAQHFGVPQRRRRVFIVALDTRRGLGADSAAEVLSVGSRCDRHPPTGVEAGPGTAERAIGGVDIARTITGTSGKRHDEDIDTLVAHSVRPRSGMPQGWNANLRVGSSPDAGGVRAPDGLAGGLDHRPELAKSLLAKGNSSHAEDLDTYVVAATLNSGGNDGGFRTEPGEHLVLSPTLRVGPAKPADGGPGDTVPIVVGVLLPLGLDSHRYRCCGNGVVSTVPEWFGQRLAELFR